MAWIHRDTFRWFWWWNYFFAFCSVKVPPTRAKSPKFTSSRRKSCNDTPQTPEGKNTNATSTTRPHRHSIGASKDASRVQCSPKSGVATKTRSVKPELKALWSACEAAKCCDCLCTNRIAWLLAVSISMHFLFCFVLFYTQHLHQKEGCRANDVVRDAGPCPHFRLVLVKNFVAAGTMWHSFHVNYLGIPVGISTGVLVLWSPQCLN